MVVLSAIPENVDIKAYGGDTFTLEVRASAEVTDGMSWDAAIRSARDSDIVDSVFLITPPPTGGGSAYLTLTTAESSRLVGNAPVVTRRDANGISRSIQQYVGVWDCQISMNQADPVRTLIQGTITIELDVTRPS